MPGGQPFIRTYPRTQPWQPVTINRGSNAAPQVVKVADLDIDGLPDVVVGYPGDGGANPEIAIYFQVNPINFIRFSVLSGPGATGVAAFDITDISGDGRPDIIAGCNGQIVFLRAPEQPRGTLNWFADVIAGSSGAGFGQWTDVAVTQVDGLFGPDIVACNSQPGRLVWFRAPQVALSGNGWIAQQIDITARSGASAILIEDVDRDSRPDVVSAAEGEAQSSVAWYRHPGLTVDVTLVWQRFGITSFAGPTRLAVDDVDRDGRRDVVALSPSQNRVGWFRQPIDLTAPSWSGFVLAQFDVNTPVDIGIGDVEVNGQPDVVVATANAGGLRWFTPINNVQAAWVENNLADFALNVNRMDLADIDRDGRLDVVTPLIGASASEDTVAWFANPEF